MIKVHQGKTPVRRAIGDWTVISMAVVEEIELTLIPKVAYSKSSAVVFYNLEVVREIKALPYSESKVLPRP